MRKCKHGVYIPERMGESLVSDGCSICQSENPQLDGRYGVVNVIKTGLPQRLGELYDYWLRTGEKQAYDALFYRLQYFAIYIARRKFDGDYKVPSWGDAAYNAAASCLTDLPKYGGGGRAFSTWAFNAINHDLSDWVTREVEKNNVSIDDQYHPVIVPDTHAGADEKLFLKEVKSLLSEEERQLFEMKADGLTLDEIGEVLGIAHQRVSERFAVLEEKIRLMG